MKGKAIYLRPITEMDTDSIVKWRNSEAVKRYFIWQGSLTPEGHLNWYKNRVQTGEVAQFIIVEMETDTAVGSVFLKDIDRGDRKAEFGIFIGESAARGKGYGESAAKLLLDYAFNVEHLHRVYLRVLSDNVRAIRSYEKAGFVCEGQLKDDVCIHGEYKTITWMAVINPKD